MTQWHHDLRFKAPVRETPKSPRPEVARKLLKGTKMARPQNSLNCQMLSSQGKNAPSNPYPHYLVRLATSRYSGFQRCSIVSTDGSLGRRRTAVRPGTCLRGCNDHSHPLHNRLCQSKGPAEVQCEFFGPTSGLNFGRWHLRGEFLEGEFFWGPLLLEKNRLKKFLPGNSGPKFGRPKIVSQNSGPNSGFGGAKSPVQKFVPETLVLCKAGWCKTGLSSCPLQASML